MARTTEDIIHELIVKCRELVGGFDCTSLSLSLCAFARACREPFLSDMCKDVRWLFLERFQLLLCVYRCVMKFVSHFTASQRFCSSVVFSFFTLFLSCFFPLLFLLLCIFYVSGAARIASQPHCTMLFPHRPQGDPLVCRRACEEFTRRLDH